MWKKAKWWTVESGNKIRCTLCPRYCKIGPGQSGFCYIRSNRNGTLMAEGYGRPTGFAMDPIEKKPLNHFLPGSMVLSFGTAGCNLGCKFCQNWSMSKARLDDLHALEATPEQVVALAQKQGARSIAFTYNEPIIFGEYVIDISRIARSQRVHTVMVTNGYVTPEARQDIFRNIDAANVDLKAFTDRFYHRLTFAHLQPVLDTLIWLKQETNVWLELTTLLIPGENDSDEEIKQMCDWILSHLGDSVPLHFTAFFPTFKLQDHEPTPAETLIRAWQIALKIGIKFCYVGNIHHPEAQTTFCPACHKPLIERNWHQINRISIQDGTCAYCGETIPGVW